MCSRDTDDAPACLSYKVIKDDINLLKKGKNDATKVCTWFEFWVFFSICKKQ